MKIALAGLLALAMTSAPISAALYWYTPTPQFVEEARAVLDTPAPTSVAAGVDEHVDTSLRTLEELKKDPLTPAENSLIESQTRDAASVISWIPIAYSVSAGMVLGWCLTLFMAYLFAQHNCKVFHRSVVLTRDQRMIFKGLAVLATVNFGVLVLLTPAYVHILDSVVMWNLGMLGVLAYYSLNLRRFFAQLIEPPINRSATVSSIHSQDAYQGNPELYGVQTLTSTSRRRTESNHGKSKSG